MSPCSGRTISSLNFITTIVVVLFNPIHLFPGADLLLQVNTLHHHHPKCKLSATYFMLIFLLRAFPVFLTTVSQVCNPIHIHICTHSHTNT